MHQSVIKVTRWNLKVISLRIPLQIHQFTIYIRLGIQRCDGPGRHIMLTIINAYYGYYGILLIHLYTQHKVQSSTF